MKTIQLEHPITVHGRQVTQITLRRPKVKDQLIAVKSAEDDAERELLLLANLSSELSPDDLKELDVADYRELQGALSGFFLRTSPSSEKE